MFLSVPRIIDFCLLLIKLNVNKPQKNTEVIGHNSEHSRTNKYTHLQAVLKMDRGAFNEAITVRK